MRTAHGAWTQREGLLVRLEAEDGNGNGKIVFGECAPIPWFGTETVGEAAAACAALGGRVSDAQLDAVSAKYPCLGFAFERLSFSFGVRDFSPAFDSGIYPAARTKEGGPMNWPVESGTEVPHSIKDARLAAPVASLPVAALLPAGRAALEKIPALSESGFRAFKWKVGLIDASDELALLDDVLAALPSGASLRLDANGAWTRRAAERWLARCADYPIEFVEQPIAPDAKNSDDLLLGLAGDYPTPLALDESVATAAATRRWLRLGWPGVFVTKPSLLGGATGGAADDAARVLAELPPERTVFSSALETAVGARAALRLAFQFYSSAKAGSPRLSPRALGFGAWPLFRDARFDGPRAAPFVCLADLENIEPEILWNALN